MPTVPSIPGGASGQGLLSGEQPSQANLLMAAAEMHSMGRLGASQKPSVTKPHNPRKKLKVIK